MTRQRKRRLVFAALVNAVDNGYPNVAYVFAPIYTAIDLVNYDAQLGGEDPETLVPFIIEWRERKETE